MMESGDVTHLGWKLLRSGLCIYTYIHISYMYIHTYGGGGSKWGNDKSGDVNQLGLRLLRSGFTYIYTYVYIFIYMGQK